MTGATGVGVTGATGETPFNALQFFILARKAGSVLTGSSSVPGTTLIWRTDGNVGVVLPAGIFPPNTLVPVVARIRTDGDVIMDSPESDVTIFSTVDSWEDGAFRAVIALPDGRTVTAEFTVLHPATITNE